jgi:hypothetical protein
MIRVFKPARKKKSGLIQKLLGKEPVENAFIELNNLLAEKDISSISENEVQTIARHYKIDLYKKFLPKLKSLYAHYLSFCLSDKSLSTEELENLKKLKLLLRLKDADNNR